jgi:hypothetical protein
MHPDELNGEHPEIPEPFELPELAAFYGWLIKVDFTYRIKQVGRKDPCPCGSGKMKKDCCKFFPVEKWKEFVVESRRLQATDTWYEGRRWT